MFNGLPVKEAMDSMPAQWFHKKISTFIALLILSGALVVHQSHNHGVARCGIGSHHTCTAGHPGEETVFGSDAHESGVKGRCAACYIINHIFSRQPLNAALEILGSVAVERCVIPADAAIVSVSLCSPNLRAPPLLPVS